MSAKQTSAKICIFTARNANNKTVVFNQLYCQQYYSPTTTNQCYVLRTSTKSCHQTLTSRFCHYWRVHFWDFMQALEQKIYYLFSVILSTSKFLTHLLTVSPETYYIRSVVSAEFLLERGKLLTLLPVTLSLQNKC